MTAAAHTRSYTSLAIEHEHELIFGRSPLPVRTRGGLTIGAGTVYPELNFTLPPMSIGASTMPAVRAEYEAMIEDALERAVALELGGLVVEFELLPELTAEPQWGAEITAMLREALDRYRDRHGLLGALRVTPNDIREFVRPPLMREGEQWERMMRSFELCAEAGADMLAIESTGGKELHDGAIVAADLPAATLALGVLGARDMAFLWDAIVAVARARDVIPSGDTACGFANTAMVLAEMRHIPRVWAAVIRVMTVARSLVAYERGALGPSKDCAYEGPYLKAITGRPIALEGAEAAVAHCSPVGNIARAAADLWSNESIANVKLLGGMAPTVSLEQLVYATRLMNTATDAGAAGQLRDLFVASDAARDPQAYVLRPDVVIHLSRLIVEQDGPYARTRVAASAALAALRAAHATGELSLPPRELKWLDRLSAAADALPESESDFLAQTLPIVDRTKTRLDQYELEPAS
jgi:methanol---5-hydroxybenzimidazolylcobamide Co-methyltransferase